ncbi:hypothetical protein EON67_06905 [archaeon]|nr:MAG: hypothetical protein EON67_06905 [archaeon]
MRTGACVFVCGRKLSTGAACVRWPVCRFRIDVETVHVDNDCELDNVVGLTPEELKHRKVEVVDIRAAYHDTKAEDYNEHFDVTSM